MNTASNILKWLRALLPIPAALAAWILALIVTLRFDYWRVVNFCPENMREGSDCYTDEWQRWPLWLICGGAALSAVFVVWSAALTASGHRVRVAALAYLIGSSAALVLGGLLGFLLPAATAIAAGAVALWSVARVGKSRKLLECP
ncbi:hypothetical protein [Microbulbifer taiwanensis]|uniref:Uncharacterized protein n=1 Tax=Microbulbifer taiwanensis TaxID=986746 RepID=A0ABW1YS25_9GAMM|nr:hypothetical protein [Microbulbifer taiwanensis]